MHINRKRQFDSKSALDAQPSAQEAKPTRRAFHKYSLQRWALACFGVLGTGGLLTLAGCPANLEDPERFNLPGAGGASAGAAAAAGGAAGGIKMLPTGVDLTCITPLFATSCATSTICHTAGSGTGLDLVSSGFEARLVNIPAKHLQSGVTDCPMVNLIDTAMPMKSWLLAKITPGAFGDCGALMPLAATATPVRLRRGMPSTKFVNDEATAANGGTPPAAGGAPATGGASGASGAPAAGGASGAGSSGAPAGGTTAGSGGM